MQQSVLPPRWTSYPTQGARDSIVPARETGGDFYDFFFLNDHDLGLKIADVSSKGDPASLFRMLAQAFRNFACPVPCLQDVNKLFVESEDACVFVSAFY